MKNDIKFIADPYFYSIYCNGNLIKTSFSLAKQTCLEHARKANEDIECLKWGNYKHQAIQKKFDNCLNK